MNTRDSANGRTLLHRSAADGQVHMARTLLEAGVDKDAEDKNGRTPLYHAVASNRPHLATHLIEACADLDAPDNHGWTPLHTMLPPRVTLKWRGGFSRRVLTETWRTRRSFLLSTGPRPGGIRKWSSCCWWRGPKRGTFTTFRSCRFLQINTETYFATWPCFVSSGSQEE